MSVILSAKNLSKTYNLGETEVHALNNLDLDIEHGLFYTIIGKSGSGKSTLLHLLSGLDKPTYGEIYLKGKDICKMSDSQIAAVRRKSFGFIFQSYNLLPEYCVEENIKMPLYLDNRKCDAAYLEEVMVKLEIGDKRHKFPSQLSGGEQQRVAIARSLSAKPEIIFADEPTGNLDKKMGAEVLRLLLTVKDRYNQTILVTHDPDIAKRADKIIQIQDGTITT